MSVFTIDLLTGNIFLLTSEISGSTPTSGSTYLEVNLYSDLPAPAGVSGEIYVVRSGSGSYISNRKDAGLYFSTGSVWNRLGDTPAYFNSDNFQVYDGVDTSKGIDFEVSGITTGTFRTIKVQDADGTIAYLTDLDSKVDVSIFDTYTGATDVRLINIENNFNNYVPSSGGTFTGLLNGTDLELSNNLTVSGITQLLNTLNVNEISYNTGYTATTETAGKTWWNTDELALNIATGIGPVLQVGQEVYLLIYNDGAIPIPNMTVLRPKAAAIVNGLVVPTTELAKSDIYSTAEGTIMVATMNIPVGQLGLATRFGRVRGGNTFDFSPGDDLYISPLTGGTLTNIKPSFPNYVISVGGCLVSDAVNGEIFVTLTKTVEDTVNNFWNGVVRESFDFIITSSGGTITGSLSPTNGHPDLTLIYSSGLYMLDTTPAKTISLVAGTDTNPQMNYIYIPEDTKVLTVSTSDFPINEHIKIGTAYLQTVSTTATEGALKNHNWNDHIQDTTTNQGHLSHITEKIRRFPAQWQSGLEGIVTISGTTDVYISNTSGVVYQLHRQIFPARDMAIGDDVHIVNHPTTAYITTTNLNTEILDANNDSLANKAFSFVVWGVQNKTGENCHLMLNLPSGSYAKNSPDNAVNDANNHSVYDIPTEFGGTGFLIARFTFTLDAGGTTWTLYDSEDLRGKIPNTTAGGGAGGAGVTTFTGLNDTPSSYIGNGGKLIRIAAGETSLEFADNISLSGLTVNGSLDVSTTTGAFIVPRMTTGERDAKSGINGEIIYNTSDNQFNFYENSGWVTK